MATKAQQLAVVSPADSEQPKLCIMRLEAALMWCSFLLLRITLLSAALLALLRQDFLPEDLCTGVLAQLARAGRPALLRVGGLLFSERLATELWTAVGGEYRPTIAITVLTVIPSGLPTPAGPRQTQPPSFVFQDMPRDAVDLIRGADPTEPPGPDGNPQRVRQRYRLAKD